MASLLEFDSNERSAVDVSVALLLNAHCTLNNTVNTVSVSNINKQFSSEIVRNNTVGLTVATMHRSKHKLDPSTPTVVLESVFKKYDVDGNMTLEPEEFTRALSDLGVIDQHEQSALFHLADTDNGGSVCFDEFLNLIKSFQFDSILADYEALQFVYETLQKFKEFDADGDGEGYFIFILFRTLFYISYMYIAAS